MKRLSVSYIIHGFAVLHAAVALLCLVGNIQDSLLLTLLTMTMTVLLCIKHNLTVELTAIYVILVNIVGFILGSLGADFFMLFSSNKLIFRPLATFATTEILGWGLDLFGKRFFPAKGDAAHRKRSWQDNIGWIIFAAAGVFLLRMSVDIIFTSPLYEDTDILKVFGDFFDNSLMLILMICATIAGIGLLEQKPLRSRLNTSFVIICCILAIAFAAAAAAGYGFPSHFHQDLTLRNFLQIFMIAVLVEVTFYAVGYIIRFAVASRNEALLEREKTHQAEFRYMALKQQLNPHFLFNSLNILDGLILEGSKEDASHYTHHLAALYRYMLQHEGERLVRLSEEIEFTEMYKDLLLVRFPKGLAVETSIPESDLQLRVVPCALQLLVENATKHNAILPDSPLSIRITSGRKQVTVSNNLVPRLSPSRSTGLGLNYIRQQYRDLSGREITVEEHEHEYSVTLPLL